MINTAGMRFTQFCIKFIMFFTRQTPFIQFKIIGYGRTCLANKIWDKPQMTTENRNLAGEDKPSSPMGTGIATQLLTALLAIAALAALAILLGAVVFAIYWLAKLTGATEGASPALGVSVLAAFLGGLISFLSPCVLPLVPPYLGFLGGTSVDILANKDSREAAAAYRRVIVTAILFVLGFTTIFVGLGAGASVFGKVIAQQKETMAIVAGVFILLFGLHFLGIIRIPFLYRQARMEANVEPASLLGAYIMGLAFAFGWTPCVGPVLAAILTFSMQEATVTYGAGLLFIYSMGLGIPFVLAALLVGPFMGFMRNFRKHMETVEKVMGVLLIITGLLFLAPVLSYFGLQTFSINDIGTWLLNSFDFFKGIG